MAQPVLTLRGARNLPGISRSRSVCNDCAKSNFAFGDSIVRPNDFIQRVGFGDNLDFPLRRIIEGLVEIGRTVLLAADDANPAHEQVKRMDGQRLRFDTHQDQAAIRAKSLDRVGHGDRKSTRLNSSHGYISYAV